MKKLLCVLGVIALAGCAADRGDTTTGQGGGTPESTGTNSAAATATAKDNIVVSGVTYRREFPAYCVANSKLYIAGGYDETGTAKTDIFSFDPAAGTGSQWSKLSVTLSTARGEAQSMLVPTTSTECLFVGGKSSPSGTAIASAELLDVSSTPTVSSAGSLNNARVHFQMSQCGTAKVLAVGGHTNATSDVFVTAAEVWDGSTTWTTTDLDSNTAGTQGIANARAFFSLVANDASFTQFVVTGGLDATGVPMNTVELYKMTSACAAAAGQNYNGSANTTGTKRAKLVGFPQGTANHVLAVGGIDDTGTVRKSVDEYTVDFTTSPPSVSNRAAGTDMTTARYLAMTVPFGSNYLVGGGLTSLGATTTALQIWSTSNHRWEDAAGTNGAEDQLVTSRYGAGLGRVGTKLAIAGGLQVANGGATTILTSAEQGP